MPYIDEPVFDDQMRGLMVARGNYLSAKDKEEKKRYWYLEFRSCDERAFIRVMEQLKFAGDNGFPSFRDFKDRYNIIMPAGQLGVTREYCGLCVSGTVIFRDVVKESGEVADMAAGCSRCSPNRDSQINPHNLHKDRGGKLRTFEALAIDRVPQEIKMPEFYKEHWEKKNKDKKMKTEYFTGLHPMSDPDYEYEIKAAPMNNGKDIARAMLAGESPKKEKTRDKSIKRAAELPEVPY